MIKDKNKYKILVVEDNPGDYLLIEDYLNEQITAPEITHVKNFASAKNLLEKDKHEYHVILLDLTLPDKSGKELITEVNLLGPACPVIVLTGYTDIAFSIQSLSLGIADYLLKDDITASSIYKSIIYNIERKKTNLKLRESEQRYSNLFHLSPQPMWLYDPVTLGFIQVNEAALSLYGYSEKEFIAMTILDLRPEEDRNKIDQSNQNNSIGNDTVYRGRFRHVKKSGEILEMEIYRNPITLNDKVYIFIIAIDVTEKILFDHKITKAIIKTQEDERYEIGSELHDNVCQLLATSLMSLGMMKDTLPTAAALSWYDRSREYIMLATEEIRNLSHQLAPAFFEDATLEDSFTMLLKSFNIDDKFKIHLFFNNAAKEYVIPTDIHLNLYRILQEQLLNILKYSKATDIIVDMILVANNLKMRIKDNGVGFDTSLRKEGIGLANIKRRCELFFGDLEIISSPGNGCDIVITIPMQLSK
ncbi:MAG: PAS domain S-box protein [Ferruginibacter sp.]